MKKWGIGNRRVWIGVVALCAFAASTVGAGPGSTMVRVGNHVPLIAMARSQHIGRLPSNQPMSLAVALNVNDEAALGRLIERLHDPSDALYGQFLTPDEFTQQFAPTQQQFDEVAKYLGDRGLVVAYTHPNRMIIDVTGSASDVENAFQLEMHQYQTPEGQTAFAPNVDPLVSDAVSSRIAGVVGLSSFGNRKSHAHIRPALQQPLQVGSGPGGALSPSDIKKAYNLSGLTQTGTGQTLALFELDGYTPSDITGYTKQFGITAPPLQNILVDTATGAAGAGAGEVTLDIELMMAIAPGVTKILVYEGPNSDAGVIDTYAKIANDNLAKEVSTSWGGAEDQMVASTMIAEKNAFMQMASQGQSIFAAAGDSGAYDDGTNLSVDDPASDPYVVGVGGTNLKLSGTQTYVSESTWAIPASGGNAAQGGGGGISTQWTLPSWQAGIASKANLGSTAMRMVPDVSLDADPNTGYAFFYKGAFGIVGGTSCAAPLWAAFTALINEQRLINKTPVLGFANPAIYQLASSANYALNFHDIADGSTNLHFPTTTAYDLATGWGSFNGTSLFNSLVSPVLPPMIPAGLALTPHNHLIGVSWSGSTGAASYTLSRGTSATGPFTPVASATTATSFQDIGLINGTTYYYVLTGVNSAGTSGNASMSAAPALVVPQTPTSFTLISVAAQ